MAVELNVPALGESITEAVVGKWHKKVGDAVTVGRAGGRARDRQGHHRRARARRRRASRSIAFKEGDKVTVGEVLGTIDAGAAPRAAATAAAAPAAAAPAAAPAAAAAPRPPTRRPRITPVARRHAPRTTGVDAVAAQGLRRRRAASSRTTCSASVDAAQRRRARRRAAPRRRPPARAPTRDREERVKMTPLRKRVAERLVQAQSTAAILTTFNEVDMGAVMALRKQYNEKFQKQHGVKLGLHELLRPRRRSRRSRPSRGQRGDRRRRRRLQALLRHRRGGVRQPRPGGAGAARRGHSCRWRRSRRRSPSSARRRATTSSRWPTCRAARSPSPTAASSARCCPRPSSTRRRPASSGMHNIVERAGGARRADRDPPDDVPGALATTTGWSTAARRCSSSCASRSASRTPSGCCSRCEAR